MRARGGVDGCSAVYSVRADLFQDMIRQINPESDTFAFPGRVFLAPPRPKWIFL